MNYISFAKETKRITKEGKYELNGTTIYLPKLDYTDVKVYSPEMGEHLLNGHVPSVTNSANHIKIVAEDSFQAAGIFDNPLVMNFANAHKPGGGFEMGGNGTGGGVMQMQYIICFHFLRKSTGDVQV